MEEIVKKGENTSTKLMECVMRFYFQVIKLKSKSFGKNLCDWKCGLG